MALFEPQSRPAAGWRRRAFETVFESDTRAGLVFDALLLVAILVSIVTICLETVESFADQRTALRAIEWVLTGLFTIEYIVRVAVVDDRRRYATSFMGIVDLVALLPTYLSVFIADMQVLQVVRALRLLRLFRVLELGPFTREGNSLSRALWGSRHKIAVFLLTILVLVVIQGALIYFIEHDSNPGFSSIPRSIYWAVVTVTTVGYGDISPRTVPGQFVASALMLLGYCIIAVPTGIVSAQLVKQEERRQTRELDLIHQESGRPGECLAPILANTVVDGAELGRMVHRIDD